MNKHTLFHSNFSTVNAGFSELFFTGGKKISSPLARVRGDVFKAQKRRLGGRLFRSELLEVQRHGNAEMFTFETLSFTGITVGAGKV